VASLALTTDGKSVLACASDGELRRWDVASGREIPIKSPQFKGKEHLRFASNYAQSGVFSPDRRQLAVLGSRASAIHLADLESSRELFDFPRGEMVAFSPDGKSVAVGKHERPKETRLADGGMRSEPQFSDTTVQLLDATTGKQRLQIVVPASYVQSLAFSPDGSTLATSSGWNRGELHLFRTADGFEILKFELPTAGTMGLCFTPDSKSLATGLGDTSVVIWDVSTRP
jgi:WD40 repeat protein